MTVDTASMFQTGTVAREIEDRFGAEVALCYQCKRCTSGCPAVDFMEFRPHQLVRLVRLGAADRSISTEAIWNCVGCYACTARCPQDVPITELIYSLKGLAMKEGKVPKGVRVPAFLKAFAGTVERHGRNQETQMLVQYYLTTDPKTAVKETPTAIKLFRQGRLPLLPHRVRGWKAVKRVLRRVRRGGGEA